MVWRAVLLGISGAVFWAIYVLARASEDYPKRAGGIAFMAAIAAAIALAIAARRWVQDSSRSETNVRHGANQHKLTKLHD